MVNAALEGKLGGGEHSLSFQDVVQQVKSLIKQLEFINGKPSHCHDCQVIYNVVDSADAF